MNLTERDLSVMSRKMPPDKWKYILRECLDISEADISRAEYSCRGEAVQGVIFKVLNTWKDDQDFPVTRQDMYIKLEQARQLGICQTTDWYQFLLPEGVHRDVAQPAPQMQIGIFPKEGILLWILNNPLQVNYLMSAVIFQFCFTSTPLWNTKGECGYTRKQYEQGISMWLFAIGMGCMLQTCIEINLNDIPQSSMTLLNLYFDHSKTVGLLISALNICILTFSREIEWSLYFMAILLCMNNVAAYNSTTNGCRFTFVLNLVTSSMIGALIAHVILYLCHWMKYETFPFSFLIIFEILNFLTWLMSGTYFTNFLNDVMLNRDMATQGLVGMWQSIKSWPPTLTSIENLLSCIGIIQIPLLLLFLYIYQVLEPEHNGIPNINFLPLITGDCITLAMLYVHKLLRLISHQYDKPFHEKTTLIVLLALNSCILTLVNGHHSKPDFLYHFKLLLFYPTQPFNRCLLL